MKDFFALFFVFVFISPMAAQDGFQFQHHKNKVVIPFESINNLIFIPIKVNGVELNFLLDTGVDETILFSLEEKDELRFSNIEKIKLRGLGVEESIEGLKSTQNILAMPNLVDTNHELYIVLDQDFNFSSHIGIPVNGIIGYHFFKDHLVELNYDKKRITIYEDKKSIRKKIKKQFLDYSISIEKRKPYLVSSVRIDQKEIPVKLLLDSGNSDALWLFQNRSEDIKLPTNNFDDFLGRGFSGDIFGKRARISNLAIDKFNFENPIAAFPDSSSVENVSFVKDRMGSVGGEILKRFTVLFDYKNNKLFLKKGREFKAAFNYNMSGMEVQHQGLQWVQETVGLHTAPGHVQLTGKGEHFKNDFKYKFTLKPIYSIANVRKNSPAALSGIQKGDVIITINKSKGYRYTLQEINALLKSEEGKVIEIEIERNNTIMQFQFQLKSIL